jgi:hypothetical protein
MDTPRSYDERDPRRTYSWVALVFALMGCDRSDTRVLAGYRELWAQRDPKPARAACPDAESKRRRLAPVLALLDDAYRSRHHYDQPLPDALRERLLALDTTRVADDYRCLAESAADQGLYVALGALAAMLMDKAEARADPAPAAEALHLYRDVPFDLYFHFMNGPYFLERAARLPQTSELREAEAAAKMPRATFCAGMKEEWLEIGAILFYRHLHSLRRELLERWSDALAPALKDDAPNDYAAFKVYRAFWDAAVVDCATRPPAEIEARVRAATASAKQPLATFIAATTERLTILQHMSN